MKHHIHFLLFFFLISLVAKSQNEVFQKKEFVFKNGTIPYRVMFPENYDKTKKYPLVLFLHGAGERGSDNEKQLVHGASQFSNPESRIKYPAIVLFPQCPSEGYWAPIKTRENGFGYEKSPKPTPAMEMVIKLLNSYKKTEAVDKNRIYVVGLSMGGMGTYDLICRYPKTFAAAIPICGGVNLERLKKVRKMPIRIYHGADDNIVSPEHSRDAYIELKANGARKVEYFEFAGVGHNSWTPAFAQSDFLEWLFSQNKNNK